MKHNIWWVIVKSIMHKGFMTNHAERIRRIRISTGTYPIDKKIAMRQIK